MIVFETCTQDWGARVMEGKKKKKTLHLTQVTKRRGRVVDEFLRDCLSLCLLAGQIFSYLTSH